MRNTSLLFGLHEWNICVREHRKVFVVGSIKERVWELCMTAQLLKSSRFTLVSSKFSSINTVFVNAILSMLVQGNFNFTNFSYEICELQFSPFFLFWVKNLDISAWFHANLHKLYDFGVYSPAKYLKLFWQYL